MENLVKAKLESLDSKHKLGGYRGIANRLSCSHMTIFRAMSGDGITAKTQELLGRLFPSEAPGEVWAQLNAIDELNKIRKSKIENQIIPIL